MSIAERMKKIREHRGLKQFTVAQEMNVSQQAYSLLEKKTGNHKVETLKRFCEALKVDMSFLVASEIPVTDENMLLFDTLNYTEVFEEYKKIKNRLSTYEEIILKRTEQSTAQV